MGVWSLAQREIVVVEVDEDDGREGVARSEGRGEGQRLRGVARS